MTKYSIGNRPLLSCVVLLLITLSACTTVNNDWQLKITKGDLKYYTRAGPINSLPEFKATIEVAAPVDNVMNFIMDFSRHTEWVHGCEQSSIITLDGYTAAYIYQVIKLPVVRGRDMILLANIAQTMESSEVVINLAAVPDYCDKNDEANCAQTRNTGYIRVEQAAGTFVLSPLGANKTHIEWVQAIDPAGALPGWLISATLLQVPIKSLRELKQIMESGGG